MSSNMDSVSLTNGNLMLHIPLANYPQRGGKLLLAFYLRYNNKGFRPMVINNLASWSWDSVGVDVARDQVWEPRQSRQQFLSYTDQPGPTSGTCGSTTGLCYQIDKVWEVIDSVATPDGGSHTLDASPGGGPGILDGSALGRRGVKDFYDSTSAIPVPASCNTTATSWNPLNSEDPNGNIIQTTASGWIDTLGRLIPAEPTCPVQGLGPYTDVTLGGMPGGTSGKKSWFNTQTTSTQADVRMKPGVATTDFTGCPGNTISARIWNLPSVNGSVVPIKFCYASFLVSTHFNNPAVQDFTNVPVTLLQNVILPNGQMWSFDYSPDYGDLISVTNPLGGTVTYTWNTYSFCSGVSRAITSRTVHDETGTHIWNYTWMPGPPEGENQPPTPTMLLVTDPELNDSLHVSTPEVGCSYYETYAEYFQGSAPGNSLKRIETSYETFDNPLDILTFSNTGAAFPTTVKITWPNGEIMETQTVYDTPTEYNFYNYTCFDCDEGGPPNGYLGPQVTQHYRINGQTTQDSVFDWTSSQPPGPLLRTVSTSYFTLDDPSSVIVTDANGNKCSETDFNYDEPNTLIPSGITTQHGDPYLNAVRANLTSATRQLSDTPCSPNATWTPLETTYTNFDTGERASATDANGNTTNYSYSPTFYGAYQTQTQFPDTVSNGTTIHHIVSGDYDLNTGLLTRFTDQNQQSTTYTYDDPLQRLTEVDFPPQVVNGVAMASRTTFSHNDTPGSVSVQRTRQQDGMTSITDLTYFDGFGRPVKTQLNDPEGNVFTATTYDDLGRVSTVTNPYRTLQDPTYGVMTTKYDPIGRVTEVDRPDGSTVLTSYTGRATQVQDEGNGTTRVTHISQTDALGRLQSVCEVASATQAGGNSPAACGQDIPGTGFLTTYQYDALENLTGVQQGALIRSFAYDSLSRLLRATNPESGTTSYSYDVNGNLRTRTRPAPNQADPNVTVTTTYQYDQLNRLTQQSYSDGITPSVSRHYDTSIELGRGLDNTIGRLSAEFVTDATGNIAAGQVYGYDPMGRVVDNSQCTPQNCASATAFPLTYSYDLLGKPLSVNNGQGTILSYTYDTAEHLLTVASSLSDVNHPATLFSATQYNALGTLTTAGLGNGLYESYGYDTRGRLTSYASSFTAPPVAQLALPRFRSSFLAASLAAGGTSLEGPFLKHLAFRDLAAIHAKGSILISGSSAQQKREQGVVTVTIRPLDSVHRARTMSVPYQPGATAAQIAEELAQQLEKDDSFPLNVWVSRFGSAAVIELVSRKSGDRGSFDISVVVTSKESVPSITVTASGAYNTPILLGALRMPR